MPSDFESTLSLERFARAEKAEAEIERLRADCARLRAECARRDAVIDVEREARREAMDLLVAHTQAQEALERAVQAEAEIERLRAALVAEREDVLWNAYHTGHERDGVWHHGCISDGEWLTRECGFDAAIGKYPADTIKSAIPEAARRAALTKQENQK